MFENYSFKRLVGSVIGERNRGPPSLLDDVSKLKNIRKDSRRHKDLQKNNINTVEDFLVQHFKDPEHLEQVLLNILKFYTILRSGSWFK